MTDLDRRSLIQNGAAAVATAALPAAVSNDEERRIRAVLIRNVERSAAALADAKRRGETTQTIEHFYGYGHQLDREELRLFDRYQGPWRELYGLPVVHV